MTRYARGGQANKKKPNEATSWAEMKADHLAAARGQKRQKPAGAGDSGGGGKVITRLKNGQFVVKIGSYQRVLHSEAELRRWKRSGSEARRLARKQRRDVGRVCFNCRRAGHLVADCPEAAASDETVAAAAAEADKKASAVCFRCGAGDHSLAKCPKMPRPSGDPNDHQQQQQPDLPFASCFVCGKSGHLSRTCPDNPRGLYPKGGGCLLCSSVEHFKRDCPLGQKRRAAEASAAEVALPTAAAGVEDEVPLLLADKPRGGSLDADADEAASGRKLAAKKRRKGVKVVVL